MKIKHLIFAVILIYIGNTTAQELALVREYDSFGYINKTGNYAIKPQFKKAKNFSNGVAVVLKDKKWGVINNQGKLIIPAEYNRIKQFNSGYGLVYQNKKWKYMSKTGEILKLETVPDKYYDFNNGVAIFRKDGKIGLLGTNGKLIIEPQYDEIRSFDNGYAKVRNGKKWGIIDTSGKIIIPIEYHRIGKYSQTATWGKKEKTLGFIINKIFTSLKGIDRVWNFDKNANITRAISNKRIGFINAKGEWIIKPMYKKLRNFNQGLAPAHNGDYWGFINKKGEEIIPFKYKDAEVFSNDGLAPVKNKLWGFTNTSGKIVIPYEYGITVSFSFIKKNVQKGFIDGLARVKYRDKWGFINKEGEPLGGKWYKNVELFVNTSK